jgi:hypothetical protein
LLSSQAKKALDLDTLIGGFQKAAADNRPAFAGVDNDIEKARSRLLAEIDNLDDRVLSTLATTSVHEWTMYGVLVILLLVLTVFVPFGLVTEQYWVAVTAAGGPFAACWPILYRLKVLRNDNVALRVMLLRYRPRAVVCDTLACLDALAREIEQALRQLTDSGKSQPNPPGH